MSESDDQAPRIEPLMDEALDWVLLLRSGRATIEDAEALQDWRDRSAGHEQAFREAARTFRDLGIVAQKLMARELERDRNASRSGTQPLRPPLSESTAEYSTQKGEQCCVALAKCISLKLNTSTSIAVRSAGMESRVELISGEVAITAGRVPSDPLVITATEVRMIATQATLNVRCIRGVITATCIDGMFIVEQGGRSVQLLKGQEISYSAANGLSLPMSVDLVQATAWQGNLLIFRDQPLAAVIDEINRYRPGKVILMNSALGRRITITRTLPIDRLEDFISGVGKTYGVGMQSLPAGIVLLH